MFIISNCFSRELFSFVLYSSTFCFKILNSNALSKTFFVTLPKNRSLISTINNTLQLIISDKGVIICSVKSGTTGLPI